MPPATPRTTRRGAHGRLDAPRRSSARRSSRPALISRRAIDSGFSCDVGLDQRADVLEQALAELAVVGVDLARALGREDHQRVLGVGLLEQLVDRRVGDAFGRSATVPDTRYLQFGVVARRAAGRSAAGHAQRARHESHASYQLVRGPLDVVVDDRHVELRLGGQLDLARCRAGAPAPPASSVPRPTSRRTSSSQLRRGQEDEPASGMAARTWRAPCRSISSRAGCPARSASSTGRARRAVPVPPVNYGPLQQLAGGDQSRRTRPRSTKW